MPTVEELNAALAGVPAGQSGAAYGQADPYANLWEYWRPGGNGGGQAGLDAFYKSGRWRESQYGGVSDAQAKLLYDAMMARYGATPTPGVPTGVGGSAYTPPTVDLPGIRRPPELDLAGADASYMPASSPWVQRGQAVLGALDGVGSPSAHPYGLKPRVPGPGYAGRLV